MKIQHSTALDPVEFASALTLAQAHDLRLYPDLPPTTEDELVAWFTADRTEGAEHQRFVGFDGDDAVAIGHLEIADDPANPTFAAFEITTLREDAGLKRTMLARLLDLAEARGRTELLPWALHTPFESQLWEGLGATLRYTERMSQLVMGDVDADLMERWILRRTERAAELKLVHWERRCPDRWLTAYSEATNAMNDAPRDDIDFDDRDYSEDYIRHEEGAWADVGHRLKVLLVVDGAGKPIATTSIFLNLHRPSASWQGDTVVLEPYRRRGIGRWTKAEMWKRLRADHPEVTHLETGNAHSNDPMLSINAEMGYRETHVYAGWQADLDTYRANL